MLRISRRFERVLTESSLITAEQLADAKGRQSGKKSLIKTIAELGFASEKDVARTVAKGLNLEYVDLDDIEIDPTVASLVPDETARRHSLIVVAAENGTLKVAMVDPANIFAVDDLRMLTGKEIEPFVSTEMDITAALDRLTNASGSLAEMVETAAGDVEFDSDEDREDADGEEAPAVKVVNLILTRAVSERASDIFVEPQEKDLRVRFRIDGVLKEIMRIPRKMLGPMTSRLKIMSGLDIAERRVPQDGRFGIVSNGHVVDFRVATLPTVYGEDVVLRLLRKDSIGIELNDLGFSPSALTRFRSSFTKPYGAILVTGPTGSGKTTTLYGALHILNSPARNLITVEDPVEYRVAGINQVQVSPRAGMTFAAALRSILRNDPDIVMIGEIRDTETALIAVESALTGHLVLSTLHTNSSAGAITRLIEMDIEPFLVSSAVDCVVAQRLARRLCTNCRQSYKPSVAALMEIGVQVEEKDTPQIYKPVGCEKCDDTGYHGRVGLYEVLLVSETIERLTVARASADEIEKVAIEEGMVTMRMDGYQKLLAGQTTIEEILRVTA